MYTSTLQIGAQRSGIATLTWIIKVIIMAIKVIIMVIKV